MENDWVSGRGKRSWQLSFSTGFIHFFTSSVQFGNRDVLKQACADYVNEQKLAAAAAAAAAGRCD